MSDVVLTKEQQEALGRCAPIRISQTFDYVPKAYRELPEEMRPVFHLRTMKEHERFALNTSKAVRLSFEGPDEINTGLYTSGVCHIGICGWDNYRADVTDAKSAVKWEGSASVDVLPYTLLLELCNEILSAGTIKPEEVRGLG